MVNVMWLTSYVVVVVLLQQASCQGESRKADTFHHHKGDVVEAAGEGCSAVQLNGLSSSQSSRRGRYTRTSKQCSGEQEARFVYKQDRGKSYMYYVHEPDGWQGWQVGSSSCRNQAGVAVRDNATVPEAVTGVWEEYYYNGWVANPRINVTCTSSGVGLTFWEIIGIIIGCVVIFAVLCSVGSSLYRSYQNRKQHRSDDNMSLPSATAYSNDGYDDDMPPPPSMPANFLAAPPSYDNCMADAPPAYDEIYNITIPEPGPTGTEAANINIGFSGSHESLDNQETSSNDHVTGLDGHVTSSTDHVTGLDGHATSSNDHGTNSIDPASQTNEIVASTEDYEDTDNTNVDHTYLVLEEEPSDSVIQSVPEEEVYEDVEVDNVEQGDNVHDEVASTRSDSIQNQDSNIAKDSEV